MTIDPRDELFDDLQYGRTTPDEAEAKLRALGLPPLAAQPNPADFDPMAEVWWTLPMTIAWISRRTAAAVRDVWDAYRERCCDWERRRWQNGFDGPIYEGHFLEHLKSATLPLM